MKAVLIDDEMHCTESLNILLTKHTDVKVVEVFHNPLNALKVIERIDFDILFIDIEMPSLNGLEFIKAVDRNDFHIVFTTAYDEYAIQAFKVNAMDYLLKPISKSDLLETLEKITNTTVHAPTLPALTSRINKLAIPSMSGFEMIPLEDILYFESDGNYTRVYLKGEDTFLCTKTLSKIEEILSGLVFLRIHNSFIINLNAVSKYVKGDGGYVVLEDGTNISVSRSRKEALIRQLR